jgi:hypothetical protein
MIIKKTLTSHQQSLVILTALSVISLLFGMTFNLYGYLIKVAAVQENSNGDSTATNSTNNTNNNTIQLSVKEKSEVYKWLNSTSGKTNPTLRFLANTNNLIQIKNPTDTKHELIIDLQGKELKSSGDISPNSSRQMSFITNMTGTLQYHCEYHPTTMKGTIKVVASPQI